MQIAKELIKYIETLTLSGGDCDGEHFTVLKWQRRFIEGVFSQPGSGALSVARGNGKSCLVAALGCSVVDPEGPCHERRREVVVCASSLEQSRPIFDDSLRFLMERHDLTDRKVWRKVDSVNRLMLEHRPSGCRLRCIGSDPQKAMGLRPFWVLADEPSSWDPAKRDRMISALRTGLGKTKDSRMIILGTRPASSEHFFEKLLHGGAGFSQIHCATKQDNPFSVKAWRLANPSLDHLPSLRTQIEAEVQDAKRDPMALASLRGLRLNMGVSDIIESRLLDEGIWESAETEAPWVEGEKYSLGIDLGQSAAMSACSAWGLQTGNLHGFAVFPLLPGLAERGLRDAVGRQYLMMHERAELLLAGERVSDVPAMLREVLKRWGRPEIVSCDRWREAELRQSLSAVNFPACSLVVRGMGYRDGASGVRSFRAAFLKGDVKPHKSLLMRSGMSEARVTGDAAGNFKLSKGCQGGRRYHGRDDIVASSILAVEQGVPLQKPEGTSAGRVLAVAKR